MATEMVVTRSKQRRRILWSVAASSLLFLAACGSDDDNADASTAPADASTAPADAAASTEPMAPEESTAVNESVTTDSTATGASTGGSSEACSTWIKADNTVRALLGSGQGDAAAANAALDEAIAAADQAIAQTITDLTAAVQPQLDNPDSDGSEDVEVLYGDVLVWASESCDLETFDVTATEYHFDGLPDDLPTGYHIVNFTNNGQEMHELGAFRINDGVTESIEDVLALPEAEAMTKLTPVNFSFAMPGQTSHVSWNLAEPGNYAIVCFLPVGSIGEPGDGPAHFTQGMIHEFTVT